MPLPDPSVIRDEDEFIFTWPYPGPDYEDSLGCLSIAVDKIRETSGDTYGEMHAEFSSPTTKGRFFAHRKVNLVGVRTVDDLAKLLSSKHSELFPLDLCKGLFEQVIDRVLGSWREGAPLQWAHESGEIGEVTYAIDPFIPTDDNAVIFGQGDAKKGWLAVAMSLCWAGSQNMPGNIKVNTDGRPGVLYLDWEASDKETFRRMQWMARGLGMERVPARIGYKRMSGPILTQIDEIRRIVKRENIGLVVVDSMGPAAGGKLNSDESAIPANNAIRHLAPANRLIIAHISKGERQGDVKSASIIGSVFFDNLARSTWKIATNPIGTNTYSLGAYHVKVNTGRNRGNLAFTLAFDDNARIVRLVAGDIADNDAALSSAGGSVRDRMMLALKDGARTRQDIADALDVKLGDIRKELSRHKDIFTKVDDKLIGLVSDNDIPF